MDAHHEETITNLKARFEADPDLLALFIVGSTARDDAGRDSDVDFIIVAPDTVFDAFAAADAALIDANEGCALIEKGQRLIDLVNQHKAFPRQTKPLLPAFAPLTNWRSPAPWPRPWPRCTR